MHLPHLHRVGGDGFFGGGDSVDPWGFDMSEKQDQFNGSNAGVAAGDGAAVTQPEPRPGLIERLRRHDQFVLCGPMALMQLNNEAADEIERLQADVRRYRWLRVGDNDESMMMVWTKEVGARKFDPRYDNAWMLRGPVLDAAIDAAIAEEEQAIAVLSRSSQSTDGD